MKLFEYSCFLIYPGRADRWFLGSDGEPKQGFAEFKSFNAALNSCGTQGWELIAISRYTSSDEICGVTCEYVYEAFFKREMS
jgi:hypothetical protein